MKFLRPDEKTLLKLHQFLNEAATEQATKKIERVIGLMWSDEDNSRFKESFAEGI